MGMSKPGGHTHRLASVKKGLEPDVSPGAATLPGPFRPHEVFFWGVATSGYQAEGGYNGPGEPLNNWAWAESNGDVVPSGRTSDFWTLANEDFQRCRELGLNAFRMSVEWARIQPDATLGPVAGLAPGSAPPAFDERALYSYAQRIADCRKHGLEPIITLHHFVWPAWLGLDAWLRHETVDHFLKFLEHTLTYLLRTLPQDFDCAPPRWFITLNEPNLQAFNHYLYRIFPSGHTAGMEPTVTCLANLMEAHVRAYRKIHELYARSGIKPMVSFNNYCSDLYWSDTALLDLLFAPARKVPRQLVRDDLAERARAFDARFNAARLFPMQGPRYYLGQWLKQAHHLAARHAFRHAAWDRLIALLYESPDVPLDYVAFDYYDPFIAHALRWPSWGDFDNRKRSFRDWVLESVASKWWDWRMLPEGLAFFVKHLGRYGLPLLIAENGMALRRLPDNRPVRRRDNLARSQYLREHLRVVSRLVERGQPLIGYLHWSLFDNYEWGSFAPRFGLYSLDYTVYPTRHAVDSTGDNPSATYAAEIREARAQFAAAAQRAGRKPGAPREGSASGAASATIMTPTKASNPPPPDSVQEI
jgi:beta-glucosidase/6-phospho-beta-glucosidase/beta-galactosidase